MICSHFINMQMKSLRVSQIWANFNDITLLKCRNCILLEQEHAVRSQGGNYIRNEPQSFDYQNSVENFINTVF